MSKNTMRAYIFQCFTQEQVKEINKKIKENIWKEQNPSNPAATTSKIGKFSNVQCLLLMELVHPWLWRCQQTNKDVFGFDIYWDFHLDLLTHNVYEVGGEYGWHIDANSNTSDTKLTCLLNLSEEPYEGGEFYTIHSNEERKFDSGMGIVFNSLIAHKVTPITKGERISLSYGAFGPLWR